MKGFVIIDNGHGRETAGKRSPDGRLMEWQWTRKAARIIKESLVLRGVAAELLVPGEEDVSLRKRCLRANNIFAAHPEAVLISLHSNASGNGTDWGSASGWSAFVATAASAKSKRLAALLSAGADKRGLLGNRCTPPEGFHRASLAICRDTLCPAVLTENMFHDNKADAEFLLSEHGIKTIAELHVWALCEYFNLP